MTVEDFAYDAAAGRSASAISVLTSADGRAWPPAHEAPIVAPTTGWRARFVYACDVRHDPGTGRWYRAPIREGREAIGFAVADG